MIGKRVVRLDGLRFAAALCVLFFHFAFRGAAAGVMPSLDLPEWLVSASQYGYLGVSLFFMISGFVIAYSAEGRAPLEFAAARFARLYPSHLAAVTLTFIVTMALGAPVFNASFAQYFANLSMFAPLFGQEFMDGAYWSIVLEIIFYGWVFLFLALGLFEKSGERIVLCWLLVSLVNEMFLGLKPLRFLFLTEYSGFFAAGILIYRLRAGKSGAASVPLLALSFAIAVQTTLSGLKIIADKYDTILSGPLAAALVLGIYALFYTATSPAPTRLPLRLLSALGALTYPLYLLHQHIGYIAFTALHGMASDAALLAIVIAGLVSMAFAVWIFVDRPMSRALRARLTALAHTLERRDYKAARFLVRRTSGV
jgi:peptidoglycan/LPS O-acetylase OafA/YrhL